MSIGKESTQSPVVEKRMQFVFRNPVILCVSALSLTFSGCAFEQWSFRQEIENDRPVVVSAESQSTLEVRCGRPNQVLDSVGWVVGVPRKLLLWDRRVDNHRVGEETTQMVAEFAEAHAVDGLCVRVNQYDPLGEFSRLHSNHTVAPAWRYTFGSLRVIGYTLIPGRIFGGDHYNPYTNSVHIYSDVPALAVEATAYAKDVQERSLPGTYAAVNELPFVSIWHETVNVRDAAAFMEANSTDQQRIDGLRVLHANYGSTVAVATGAGPIAQVGAALAGQLTGRFQASRCPAREVVSNEEASTPEIPDKVQVVSASQTVESRKSQPDDCQLTVESGTEE